MLGRVHSPGYDRRADGRFGPPARACLPNRYFLLRFYRPVVDADVVDQAASVAACVEEPLLSGRTMQFDVVDVHHACAAWLGAGRVAYADGHDLDNRRIYGREFGQGNTPLLPVVYGHRSRVWVWDVFPIAGVVFQGHIERLHRIAGIAVEP